jgi:uncharacterized protein YcfJ
MKWPTKLHHSLPQQLTAAYLGSVAIAAFGVSTAAWAQEQGRVISSTPVFSQVAVPRQVCTNEQVTTQTEQKSGAGALMGGIAGGAIGNAVGNGNGRAAATMIGIFGGAILGDKVEGGRVQANTQNVQRCTTQTFYENRANGFNVVYEFNGKQYQVHMPSDPGAFVNLQVTPVSGSSQSQSTYSIPAPPAQPVQPAPVIVRPITHAPVYTQPVIVESSTVYVQPVPVYVRPAPVYVTPAYTYARTPHAHSHLHPSLQPQHLAYHPGYYKHPHAYRHHGNALSIGFSTHLR